ncbi:MAG TPA: hypothetical protein VM925_22850 [Labilithrix sp.]|nr:hypothetical protein [Labilithrix sp.]
MNQGKIVVRTAAGLLLTATAACSLASFDGFVGSADPEERELSGADATPTLKADASGIDSAVSSTSSDAGTDADAGDPNAPPVFVDGGSFCSGQSGTKFCDDFDTAPLSANWIREGIYAKHTSYRAKSAPNDFLVDVPPALGGGTFVAKVTKAFDDPSTNLVVGFDVKQERADLGTAALIMSAVEWTRGTAKYSIRLVYSAGSVRLEESDTEHPADDVRHGTFTLDDKWTRIGLDIVASGGSPTMKVTLDGIAAPGLEAVAITPPTSGMDGRPTLILGAVFATNPHNGWTIRYDNATVTYR